MTYERYQSGLPAGGGGPASPDEIQSDLTQIRGEMTETLDQISTKLEPKQLVSNVVSSLSSDSGRRAYQSVANAIKRHPLPFAMIGGGIGLLVYNEISARQASTRRMPASRDDAASSLDDDASTVRDEASSGAGEAVSRVRELSGQASDKASRILEQAKQTARDGAASAREHPLVLAGLGLAVGAALAGIKA